MTKSPGWLGLIKGNLLNQKNIIFFIHTQNLARLIKTLLEKFFETVAVIWLTQ